MFTGFIHGNLLNNLFICQEFFFNIFFVRAVLIDWSITILVHSAYLNVVVWHIRYPNSLFVDYLVQRSKMTF